MEKEFIEFKVYVAHHILDEDDCYQVQYEYMLCDIPSASTDSAVQYFERHHDILFRLRIEGDYETYFDLNASNGFYKHMRLVRALQDRNAVRTSGLPTQHGYYPTIQLVPKKEIWFKKVLLSDEQVDAAKKIIHEVEQRPFKRVRETVEPVESVDVMIPSEHTSFLDRFTTCMNPTATL
jgi:hypothetical protein